MANDSIKYITANSKVTNFCTIKWQQCSLNIISGSQLPGTAWVAGRGGMGTSTSPSETPPPPPLVLSTDAG